MCLALRSQARLINTPKHLLGKERSVKALEPALDHVFADLPVDIVRAGSSAKHVVKQVARRQATFRVQLQHCLPRLMTAAAFQSVLIMSSYQIYSGAHTTPPSMITDRCGWCASLPPEEEYKLD